VSRPLRSTPTPASRCFTATTGRSASERRDRYSVPPVSAAGTLPLAARRTDPQARTAAFAARLLTFHARAADQDHAASTPDTAWPATRAAAKLIPRTDPLLGFDVISNRFRRLNDDARPSTSPDRTLLERLPGPYLTSSTPRLLPERSPRQSSANAAPGWFDACPRRTDAGEPAILHLSHSTAFQTTVPTSASFCVRDTQISRFSAWRDHAHAQVLRPRGVRKRLAKNAANDVAFR